MLALAAHLLPEVVAPGQLLPFQVHPALVQAVTRLGLGEERYQRLRLAAEARDMFAAYLVAFAGALLEEGLPGRTVAGWVIYGAGHDLTIVQRALAAAGFWRRELRAWLVAPASPVRSCGCRVAGW